MKIITVTYFYDFARYFSFLEDNMRNIYNSTDFFNVSMYPCAHRYWSKNNKHSVIPAFSSSKKGEYSLSNNLNIVNELIAFNKKAFKFYNRDEEIKLRENAINYLNYFDSLFKTENFDLLITSGESRLIPSVMIYIAKKYGVKIIYFEQGPFGKTMIDLKGVNANISFTPSFKTLSKQQEKQLDDFINVLESKKEKFWSKECFGALDKMQRFLTICCMYQPRLIAHLLPTDLGVGPYFYQGYLLPKIKRFMHKKRKPPKCMDVSNINKPYIALYLQVPVDAQLIEHSPYYDCFYQMVKDVINAKPAGYHLLIREHPQYVGKYDKRIYDLVSCCNDVSFQNEMDLKLMIRNSACSILNNSAVGIESLLLGVNVVCLGESYYSHRGITYDFDGNAEDLKFIIQQAVIEEFKVERVRSFMYEFIFEYLHDGHFQDYDLQYPEIEKYN
ncbi:hypothetical protein ACU6DI_000245 [Vibrio navarrensis]